MNDKIEAVVKCYSTNDGERFGDDYEEAMCEAKEGMKEGDTVTIWEGEKRTVKMSNFVNVDLDNVMESAGDECGEVADDWNFDHEEEKSFRKAMEEAADKWADETGNQPTFWLAENTHKVTYKLTNGQLVLEAKT